MKFVDRLIERAIRRGPDFVIGGQERPYLRRWWLLPRNPVFNVYLHQFLRSDDDRALHTHPWLFNVSLLLRGRYREWHRLAASDLWGSLDQVVYSDREAGDFKFRWGAAAHRVELFRACTREGEPVPCWTLFITGPRVRQWGFLCPQGFVHWKKFTAAGDKGAIGKGCEQ
jgi:hypothetical protein